MASSELVGAGAARRPHRSADRPRAERPARRTTSEAVRRRGRPAQAGPRPGDAPGAAVLPHQGRGRVGQGCGVRRQAELRLPAGCHGPLRLGLGARHGRPPIQVAGGAGLQADPLARRRPAGRRPVPVGRGRVPQGRRVRRLPLGPDPVHPAHLVAAPRERLRRARRAPAAACLVGQHHVLPAGLGGAAGGAPDDGHVRGSRGDEPGRGRVHGGVRSLHGRDGRDGLSGRLRRRHQGALRHRLRRLPRLARQHARPVPAAGQAAGADGDADAHGHRPGHRRRQGQRQPARVHPAASGRGRASSTTSSSPSTTGPGSRRSSSRCSRRASPPAPSSRATTRRA